MVTNQLSCWKPLTTSVLREIIIPWLLFIFRFWLSYFSIINITFSSFTYSNCFSPLFWTLFKCLSVVHFFYVIFLHNSLVWLYPMIFTPQCSCLISCNNHPQLCAMLWFCVIEILIAIFFKSQSRCVYLDVRNSSVTLLRFFLNRSAMFFLNGKIWFSLSHPQLSHGWSGDTRLCVLSIGIPMCSLIGIYLQCYQCVR